MRARVVIKLGGGLITKKDSFKSFNSDIVKSLCEVIANIVSEGISIIIVHGAGSFGHILAKEWRIAEGCDSEISTEQKDAVDRIRSDMRELDSLIVDELFKQGLRSESFPPSDWATGVGRNFKGCLEKFERSSGEDIPITFGDVVNTADEKEFGILSGDDLMLRLSTEVPDVTHSIFLIGDAPGVLDMPPGKGGELVPIWSPSTEISSVHHSEIDVTGGIRLKLDRAAEIAKNVGEVWVMDGRAPQRIQELLISGETIGTKIVAG